jgi:hypothetical protein
MKSAAAELRGRFFRVKTATNPRRRPSSQVDRQDLRNQALGVEDRDRGRRDDAEILAGHEQRFAELK